MKQVYIINENNPHLLLFFAGWACDETPFKQYRPKGMDYMVCYDYRTLDFDYRIFNRYTSVNVIGWSMGVWAASVILSRKPATKVVSTAFNGSPLPIDDSKGIPHNIYQGTLDGLTPASLQKFMRRMCSDSQAYKAFMDITPRRDFDEIKDELACIQKTYLTLLHQAVENCNINADRRGTEIQGKIEPTDAYRKQYTHVFDYAFIGKQDRIFPFQNMEQTFESQEGCHVTPVNSSHYDEKLFRFLLQEQWNMSFDEHQRYLYTLKQEATPNND